MKDKKSIFFSAITGNILEYYDFTVYAVFLTEIARTFFPQNSDFAQILMSLAVFAVGFATRPIGGILFGYIGDKYGRRVSLIFSMLGMTIPTFSMGLIPSYSEIGYYAPIILVFLRLVQGLCISGEGTGAAIFLLEHYKNMKPGFVTGLVHGSNIAGTIIASFIGLIINKYFSEVEYAWRFAFLLGGLLGLIGFNLRLRVAETPVFQELSESKKTLKLPFFYVIKNSWRQMILSFCLAGVASSITYMVKSYVILYYETVMGFDKYTSIAYSLYGFFILMISMPLSGMLVDRIGKAIVIKGFVISVIFLSLPVLYIMTIHNIYLQIISLTTLAVMAGGLSGAAYIFVISLFKPQERFSGVAFSYNLGIATFGGTSAMISKSLVAYTQLSYAPAFYLIGTSLMFLTSMTLLKKEVEKLN